MNSICVKLSGLALDGTAPQVGDQVDFTGKGKVSRIEGEEAYIDAEEINGEPVMDSAGGEMPAETDEGMRGLAEKADALAKEDV